MNLKKYLMIKTAYMNKTAEDADDLLEYKSGKKELDKTMRGFKRTLEDETTYPGYGYTQEMLGPYGKLATPKEFNGFAPTMPHIPSVEVGYDDDGNPHSETWSEAPRRYSVSPWGDIKDRPSKVFYDDRSMHRPADWTSTDLGIANPSLFGRLFGRKTINNPDLDDVTDDMKYTLDAMKYYYSKNPEAYKRAVTDYGSRRLGDISRGPASTKELDDFPF